MARCRSRSVSALSSFVGQVRRSTNGSAKGTCTGQQRNSIGARLGAVVRPYRRPAGACYKPRKQAMEPTIRSLDQAGQLTKDRVIEEFSQRSSFTLDDATILCQRLNYSPSGIVHQFKGKETITRKELNNYCSTALRTRVCGPLSVSNTGSI